jgi:hypothetical protein
MRIFHCQRVIGETDLALDLLGEEFDAFVEVDTDFTAFGELVLGRPDFELDDLVLVHMCYDYNGDYLLSVN